MATCDAARTPAVHLVATDIMVGKICESVNLTEEQATAIIIP